MGGEGHLSSTDFGGDFPRLCLTAHFLAVNVPFLFFKLGPILISQGYQFYIKINPLTSAEVILACTGASWACYP